MAKFYYDKYSFIDKWRENIFIPAKKIWNGNTQLAQVTYRSYEIINGEYIGATPGGEMTIAHAVQNDYSNEIFNFLKTQRIKYTVQVGVGYFEEYFTIGDKYQVKETLMESNIEAEDGVYPDNGIKSGFWYVKKELVHPNPPSQLKPNGIPINLYEIIKFEWKHNHPSPQSRYDFRWGTNQTTWNNITARGTNEFTYLIGGTLPAGQIYWQVRTYSEKGEVSEWSNIATIGAIIPDNAPIIDIPDIATISMPLFKWIQDNQIAYEVKVIDNINVTVWETGIIDSTERQIRSGIALNNGENYTLRVRNKTTTGLWTEWSEKEFPVSYTSPTKPYFNTVNGEHFIGINITNPEAVGLQPEIDYNDIYRNGKRIATRVGDNYRDYSARNGKVYEYYVVAVGDNEGVMESDIQEASLTLYSSILANLQNELLDLEVIESRNEGKENIANEIYFAGRSKPVIQYEEFTVKVIDLVFKIYKEETLEQFQDMINQKGILLYRDERGRKIFGNINRYELKDYLPSDNWYNVNCTLTEVDYNEVV